MSGNKPVGDTHKMAMNYFQRFTTQSASAVERNASRDPTKNKSVPVSINPEKDTLSQTLSSSQNTSDSTSKQPAPSTSFDDTSYIAPATRIVSPPRRSNPSKQQREIDIEPFELPSVKLDFLSASLDPDKGFSKKDQTLGPPKRTVFRRAASADKTIKNYKECDTKSRLIITSPNGVPIFVSSIRHFTRADENSKQENTDEDSDKMEQKTKTNKGVSYARFIHITPEGTYDPERLDDPNLRTGKHHTVYHVPMGRASVFPFVRKKKLRDELNERFASNHPELPDSISLTKIRKIKKRLIEIALLSNLDIGVVAHAFVYFEKIVLKKAVTKENRYIQASTSLFLACKFYNDDRSALKQLPDVIARVMNVTPKDVVSNEMKVFRSLRFGLLLDSSLLEPHLTRIRNIISTSNMSTHPSSTTFVQVRS